MRAVERGEPVRAVAELVEPRVPPGDVRERRRKQTRPGPADHQLGRPCRRRQQDCILEAVERTVERYALAREQAPDLVERLLEARDAAVEGQPERAELLLVPARAERHPKPPAAHLVDRRSSAREQRRRAERGASDERPELDAARDGGDRREHRPAVPRPALAATVAAVEQMVADPDRVEAGLLGGQRQRAKLGPAHLTLDLGELDADLHAQNASNAGGSLGIAVISCQTPPRWLISSTWSMSSSRPSRWPRAR